jgi:hypothetical protein
MVDVVTFSEAGGHPANEDAFEVQPHPAEAGCLLCALADGQGGRAGGAVAARLACRMAIASASRLPPDQLTRLAAWPTLLRSADAAVCADPQAGFATLLAFCVWGESLCGASSGDSAVLLINGDGSAEELTARQVKNPPVGSGAAVWVPFAARLVRPWAVLALSDGVWKYAGWEGVLEAARAHRGPSLLEALQVRARLPRSGRFADDFTLVVLHDAAAETKAR